MKEHVELFVGNYTISFDNKSYVMNKVKSDGIIRASKTGMFLVIKTEAINDELNKLLYSNDKYTDYQIDSIKEIYNMDNSKKTELISQMRGKLRSIRIIGKCDEISECVIVFELRQLEVL